MVEERTRLRQTEEQRNELINAREKVGTVRVYRRLKVVQWLADGYSVDTVLQLADVRRASVYTYGGA